MSLQQYPPPPPPVPSPARGLGAGVAGLVYGVLAACSLTVTVPASLLAALFTRADKGRGPQDWVAPAVFWSLPAPLGLACLMLGIIAVVRSDSWTNARVTGVLALSVLAVPIGVILRVAANGGGFLMTW